MEYTPEDYDRLYKDSRGPRPLKRFLRFWGAVLVTVALIFGVTAAALSLGKPEQPATMPTAKPVYESKEELGRLRHPCELPYAHRGADGRWIQGCAK